MLHQDTDNRNPVLGPIARWSREILELVPMAFATLDRHGQITAANDAMVRLFGYSQAELLDRPVASLLPAFVQAVCVDVSCTGIRRGGLQVPVEASMSRLQGDVDDSCVLFIRETEAINRDPDALEETERRLRLVMEGISGFVWTADDSGNLKEMNQGMLAYLGLPLSAIEGSGWATAIHPDDVAEAVSTWQQSVEAGVRHEATLRVRRADGVYRWFRVLGMPFRGDDGRASRWYGVAIDVHDQRWASEALKESELGLRVLVDAIPGMLCVTSAQGEVEYVNKPGLDAIGCGMEVFKDFGWKAIIHPEDADTLAEKWIASVASGRPLKAEYRQRVANGSYRWWQCVVRPFRNAAGEVVRWYGVLIDIDDRRRTEIELRTSEERLRTIVDSVPGMLCVCDSDGKLLYVNQPMRDLIGHPLDESNNYGWSQTIHADDRAALVKRWNEAVQSGRVLDAEYRRLCPDGLYRWFHVRMSPQLDSAGAVDRWYALITDVDDRVRAQEEQRKNEAELRIAQARLARSAKAATVAELAASIAHEINQPLAAIVANISACQLWLLAEPPNIAKARLTAGLVVRDANGAAAIVERIRALFKRTDPTKGALSMNEVITEVCELTNDEARRRSLQFDLRLAHDLPPAWADKTQMQQVVVNLVRNAMDAMEPIREQPMSISIYSRTEGAYVVVEVCDQGTGIANMQQVFEPFFTTKETGMGMGLQICRSIVDAHGGKIWAVPNKERGMNFGFQVPIAPGCDA